MRPSNFTPHDEVWLGKEVIFLAPFVMAGNILWIYPLTISGSFFSEGFNRELRAMSSAAA